MPRIFEFDSFVVDADKRILRRGNERLALEPKAFETLLVLLENRGETVGKDDLARVVWKDTVATDESIAQQISRLRKTLGDKPKEHRCIVTVPGVGYKFVADVREANGKNDGTGEKIGDNRAASEINFAATSADRSTTAAKSGETASAKIESFSGARILPDAESIADERPNEFAARNARENHAEKINSRRSRNFPDRRFFAAIGLAAITIVAAFYFFRQPAAKNGALDVRSIAVLPFKFVGEAAETEALKIGMADALIGRLARLEQIKILPTSSVRRFDRDDEDAIAAGRQLGVDAVLEGRIQKDGERLNVAVQLICPDEGRVLWSESYSSEFAGIFDVQSLISRKIADTLALELSDEEKRALVKRYTTNAEAYRLYLEAKYLWDRRSGGEARVVMQKNYQRAIELDPNFALAYIGLANMQTETPSRENYQKARSLAESALAIDETLAEAHESLGFALWRGEMNWTDSEKHFRRALELNANSLVAKQSLAMLLAWQNRFDEAFAVIDVYPAEADVPTSAEIALYFYRGDYDKTIELSNLRLEKRPNDVNALSFLAPAYAEKAMYEEAVQTAKRYIAFDHVVEQGGLPYLGFAYAKAGQTAKAFEILRRAERLDAPASAQINGSLAFLLGAVGERDEAFRRLEKAIEAREAWAFTLKVNPQYDSLRGDERFDRLLASVNLR